MSKICTNNIYKPSDNLLNMILKSIVWGISGMFLGVSINNIITAISNSYKNSKNNIPSVIIELFEIFLQIILCSVMLSLIHSYFNYIGWTWQNTTFGFIFVSFFFGVQHNILTNIEKTLLIDKINSKI